MTPPYSSSSGSPSFAVYVVTYVLTLASLVLDIQRGGIFFTLIGVLSSLLLTTLLVYRMAQAMALGTQASSPAPLAVRISERGQVG
jgi:hypothetical protein